MVRSIVSIGFVDYTEVVHFLYNLIVRTRMSEPVSLHVLTMPHFTDFTAVFLNFLVSFILNTVIVLQCVYYGQAVKRQ